MCFVGEICKSEFRDFMFVWKDLEILCMVGCKFMHVDYVVTLLEVVNLPPTFHNFLKIVIKEILYFKLYVYMGICTPNPNT